MGIRSAFYLSTLIIWFLVEWYVQRGFFKFLKTHYAMATQNIAKRIYLGINVFVIVLLLTGIGLAIFKDPKSYPWSSYLLGGILLFVLPKICYALFLLGEDIFSFLSHIFRGRSVLRFRSDRRKFLNQAGIMTAALPFFSVLQGMVKGRYDYEVHEIELFLAELPEAFDGFRIVHISDFHAGSFDQEQAVARGFQMIKNLEADLLLFTGDMINDFAEEVEPYIEKFKALQAPFGKFSTLGNHDYGASVQWESDFLEKQNLDKLVRHQQNMGFRLLMNESVRLEKEGQFINLIGVENWGKPPFPQKGDLNKAMNEVKAGEFNLLLSHDPSHWEAQILDHPLPLHLTLSGHTHGAQMGVETPGWKWSPAQYFYPQWAGLYQRGNQHLYVNRGFGYIGIPARMGIWPEITHLILKTQRDST